MKKVKKFLTIFLAVSCIVSCFTFFPVFAADTDLSNNLVVHYDFKGATVADALKDKASGGSVADDLSAVISNDNFTFDLEKGTVTLTTPAASGGNGTGEALKAALSADISSLNEASTHFIRFKLPDKPSEKTNYQVFTTVIGSGSRHSELLYYTGDNTFTLRAGTETAPKTSFSAYYEFDYGKYVNVAIVYDKVDSADINVSLYVSQGENGVWSKLFTNKITSPNTAGDYKLFCGYFNSSTSLAPAGVTIDDVRIYNDVLSESALSEILAEFAPAQFHGVQYQDLDGSAHNARFVGTIDEIDGYTSVGYEVVMTNGTEAYKFEVSDAKVYTSILASENGVMTPYSVEGKYLFALTVTGIDDSYDTYYIRTYVLSGTEKIYGKTVIMERPTNWNS